MDLCTEYFDFNSRYLGNKKKLNQLVERALWKFKEKNDITKKGAFLDLDHIYNIIKSLKLNLTYDSQETMSLSIIIHFMYTRGVYKIDKELMEAIYSDNILAECPSDIFLRMPQHCMYIDLSSCEEQDFGAFCHVVYTNLKECNYINKLLEISILTNGKVFTGLFPMQQNLTITKVLEDVGAGVVTKEKYTHANFEGVENCFEKILCALMYLCSQEPDIELEHIKEKGDKKKRPKKLENKLVLRPLSKNKEWVVGRNVQKVIKEYNYLNSGTGSGKCPHIRKGHWHGYYTGPRKGERNYTLKWLWPIVVKGTNLDKTEN